MSGKKFSLTKHRTFPDRHTIDALANNSLQDTMLPAIYTQSGLISTTVNVSVLVVLIFSPNFITNGAYVVLNFCKFSDTYYGPYFLNFSNKAGPYFLKNF